MIEIAIIGGGISGLWALNRFRSLGYDAHLFEKTALGTGQTIASQGIIHGGIKYALRDAVKWLVKPAPTALTPMPERWTACLAGTGEIDLRAVKVLSRKHEIRLQNRLIDIPAWVFPEPVLDVKSLLVALAAPHVGHIHLGALDVSAQRVIYTAGVGNEMATNRTQRRPLRMFMVKPNPFGTPVYLHWVGRNKKPLMTVTTHFLNGEEVLYLGGNVAEKAVGMEDEAALLWARSEIQYRFPGIPWHKKRWAIHDVDRAEPENNGELPKVPTLRFDKADPGVAAAWPAKLALAPVLSDDLVNWVADSGLRPSGRISQINRPLPPVAAYPWETARWH